MVAGDVHGCYDELMALLDKLKYDQLSDNLVHVGDSVNKVSDERHVLHSCGRLCLPDLEA